MNPIRLLKLVSFKLKAPTMATMLRSFANPSAGTKCILVLGIPGDGSSGLLQLAMEWCSLTGTGYKLLKQAHMPAWSNPHYEEITLERVKAAASWAHSERDAYLFMEPHTLRPSQLPLVLDWMDRNTPGLTVIQGFQPSAGVESLKPLVDGVWFRYPKDGQEYELLDVAKKLAPSSRLTPGLGGIVVLECSRETNLP